jgi:mono/diheme cytochrome c family protein
VGALTISGLALAGACSAADGDLVASGKRVYTEQGCYGCHTMGKTGTPVAPDLSRIGQTRSREQLARWLSDPAAQKPTAHMPKLALSEAQVRALAAYLASLR